MGKLARLFQKGTRFLFGDAALAHGQFDHVDHLVEPQSRHQRAISQIRKTAQQRFGKFGGLVSETPGHGDGSIENELAHRAAFIDDTFSADFPTTVGAFQTKCGAGCVNDTDEFVSKLNNNGSALLYSSYLGGSGRDGGRAIALDSSGNAYVAGETTSIDFPTTTGAFQTNYASGTNGTTDAFISKFSFGLPFSQFGGNLKIDPDAGVFYLNGGFKLGPGGSINPPKEIVNFEVGNYSVNLPPGSFVKYSTGYVYQKKVNGIFLCIFIKFTSTSGTYQLLANRIGGTLNSTGSPVPVTLTIGDDSGTTKMNAKFD
jgi:hypothetical protein